jgi:uncharacterized protein YkwD
MGDLAVKSSLLLVLCVLSTPYSVLSTPYSVLSTSALAASPAPRSFTGAAWHAKLVELHNAARASAKAAPLAVSDKLAQAAQAHADHMAATGQFAHEGIGDGDPSTRIAAAGYSGRRFGENIAWGPASAAGAQEVWMNSPPHRQQLLSKDYQEVGFGACQGQDGQVYWVACFGSP